MFKIKKWKWISALIQMILSVTPCIANILWDFFLFGILTFVAHLMSKPSLQKNSGTI